MSSISYHHVFNLCSYLLWWLFFKLYYTCFFLSYFIFAVVLQTQRHSGCWHFFCMFTCDENKVWSWILVMIKFGVTYASRIAAVQLSGWWRETRRLWPHSASTRPLCTCDPEVTNWETDRGTKKHQDCSKHRAGHLTPTAWEVVKRWWNSDPLWLKSRTQPRWVPPDGELGPHWGTGKKTHNSNFKTKVVTIRERKSLAFKWKWRRKSE